MATSAGKSVRKVRVKGAQDRMGKAARQKSVKGSKRTQAVPSKRAKGGPGGT